jgi:hypothetical protein
MPLVPQDLRIDYGRGQLVEADAAADPFAQFARWFADAQAAKVPEPNAMTLATADATGAPSARVVLLKGFDDRGFAFFTNYESRKGRDLAANPRAALCFYWQPLERQVRVEGTVERVSRQESDAYFNTRPVSARPRRPRAAGAGAGRKVRRGAGAAAGLLGRVPGGADDGRVLAGPPEPAARPAAVRPPAGRGVGGRPALAVTRTPAGRRAIPT